MIQNETGAPRGAAHNATANPDGGYLQQETVDAIAKSATAMVSDRIAISQLNATVARVTTEIATVIAKLAVALQTNRASRGGQGERNRTTRERGARAGPGTGTGAGTSAITRASATTIAEIIDLEPPIYYCWNCGPGCRHNSSKCPVPAPGHIYMSTRRNMQGEEEATQ